MKKIALFSDGNASGRLGCGGYASILLYSETERLLRGAELKSTANRMELRAVIEGLRVLKEPCAIEIFSHSQYVVKGISQWLETWVKRDFTKVKNLDLWQEYLRVSEAHAIEVTWIEVPSIKSELERCQHIVRLEIEQCQNVSKI